MRHSKFTFILLIVPAVLLLTLLASCSSDSLTAPAADPISADKGYFVIPDVIIPPTYGDGIDESYINSLNKDFDSLVWESIEVIFDLKGDNVYAGPESRRVGVIVTTSNDSILSLEGPQMRTMTVMVPINDGLNPLRITGDCTLYQIIDLPRIPDVGVKLVLPMDVVTKSLEATTYELLGFDTYSPPQSQLLSSSVDGYYYNCKLPDVLTMAVPSEKPDETTRRVLDPGVPGEDTKVVP